MPDFSTINEVNLRDKARELHEAITAGEIRYEHVKGRRLLNIDRKIISIPVGLRYRLVYRENAAGKLEFLRCLSHEAYNKWIGRFR